MLYLPSRGQPRPHWIVQVIGFLMFLSMGWLEMTGENEAPISPVKVFVWLAFSTFGLFVIRRITPRQPGRFQIRVLRLASARILIGTSLGWLVLLSLPFVFARPNASMWEAVPIVIGLSALPILVIVRTTWELTHPDDTPFDAPLTTEQLAQSARISAIIGIGVGIVSLLLFGQMLRSEYARHGVVDGRFTALGMMLFCTGAFIVLNVVTMVSGRSFWAAMPDPDADHALSVSTGDGPIRND